MPSRMPYQRWTPQVVNVTIRGWILAWICETLWQYFFNRADNIGFIISIILIIAVATIFQGILFSIWSLGKDHMEQFKNSEGILCLLFFFVGTQLNTAWLTPASSINVVLLFLNFSAADQLSSVLASCWQFWLLCWGVRATHNDFKYSDGREGSRVLAGYTFDGSGPLVDKQGFGTLSASIIGGLNYGVAKDITIHSDACSEGPANVETAITVAGSNQDDALNPTANFGPCVDIIAHGAQVAGAAAFFDNGMIINTNSNTAPAHVAGALALLMEKFPGRTPAEYRKMLLDMATHDVISDPKGSSNKLLFTRAQVQRCEGFDDLEGGERDFSVQIDPIECHRPSYFPDVGETPSGLIYISFNMSFSNQVDNLDPAAFVITAGKTSLEAMSVEKLDPSNSCSGFRVFAAIEQPTAFSEDSTDVCLKIDGSQIKDPCGSTFPDYEQCVRFDYCPEAQICAYGMSYSPATTTNDARSVSNENLLVVSFSKAVTDATKDKVKVLGPETYDVEVLVNESKSNVQYIKVTTPEDYVGPVTVAMDDVHDESGLQASPMKPLTYDVQTAIAGVRKDGPVVQTPDEALDRGMGDPNHVCNCGASISFNLNP